MGALIPSPSVQSPAAWARGAQSNVRKGLRERMEDSGYRFIIHPRETAAGLTEADLVFGFEPLDLRRYDISDPDAAMANAILVAREGNTGGTITLPEGEIEFADTWDLDAARAVTIRGHGGLSAGATPATRVAFTGTGSGIFIDMRGAAGCELRDFAIRPTSALFTGTLVSLEWGSNNTDTVLCSFTRMNIGDSVGKNCTHFNLDRAIEITFNKVNFVYANPAVKGQKSDGSRYCNVIKFRDCQFYQPQQAPVVWGGESWSFDNCTFEQMGDGTAGAFNSGGTAAPCKGIAFRDCWFGDVTSGGGVWCTVYGQGIVFDGNRFGGDATSYAIALFTCTGVKITGNSFDTFVGAVDFGDANTAGVHIAGNHFVNVANPIANIANVPANLAHWGNSPEIPIPANCGSAKTASPGWERTPNGLIRQWGMIAALTHGTPQSVVFPKSMVGLHAVTVSVAAVSDAKNTVYLTALDGNGFTATLGNSTAGNTANVYWQAVGY